MANKWRIDDLWNEAFVIEDDPIQPREYLYASELGNSYIETYYKLMGVPYTNTFTPTNRRKMEAGKLFEAIFRFVLKRAGILKRCQEKVEHQMKGCLSVHGRLDFIAGGEIDIKQASEFSTLIRILFEELEFPSIYLRIADKVIQRLQGMKRTRLLEEYILEIKSVSDFVYDLIENSGRAMNFHRIQAFHYLVGTRRSEARVVYINRDDCRITEKAVLNNEASYKEYAGWIKPMTDYWNTKTVPPKEPLIVFFDDTCRFGKNTMGVEWCKYLTMIYGYTDQRAYRAHIGPIVESFNRVLVRCVNCQQMTVDNLTKIKAAKEFFPNWDYLVDRAKLRKVKLADAKIIAEGEE